MSTNQPLPAKEIPFFIWGSIWGFFVPPTLLPLCSDPVHFVLGSIPIFRYLIAGEFSVFAIIGGYAFFHRSPTKYAFLMAFGLGQGLGILIYEITNQIFIFKCIHPWWILPIPQ